MRWQELTAKEFAKAVKQVKGVCVLAAGCVEKHGDHLPLGTDFLNGFQICTLAAEKEPAIVFPPYYFGQIHEARCFPGTVAIDPILTLQLLLNVCDEISRNGLHKIVIYNAHGGNRALLGYLAQAVLSRRRDYSIYWPVRVSPKWRRDAWAKIVSTPVHEHGCECETSVSLANHEHLVKMSALKGRKADPLKRLAHLPEGLVSNEWYTNYPEHYAGDATAASREKGLKLRQLIADTLADYIKAVKDDKVTADLTREFYDRCDKVGRGGAS